MTVKVLQPGNQSRELHRSGYCSSHLGKALVLQSSRGDKQGNEGLAEGQQTNSFKAYSLVKQRSAKQEEMVTVLC